MQDLSVRRGWDIGRGYRRWAGVTVLTFRERELERREAPRWSGESRGKDH